ncbi:type 4a pilus biogenesis protein PilO [Reinekea thalattae]|uniref:Type 4a pilus biogenesis protein PilO n=1 Tax=Reinekea thalattae TaxID=2593301 RepID=A0A5C8Z2U1_9GAMM|nr:type 4a pilus biogenesis protein PilO [Reinekea thalattae]TXR51867.1 hypothetical protein FME95_10590 [Reinekea thalattae]
MKKDFQSVAINEPYFLAHRYSWRQPATWLFWHQLVLGLVVLGLLNLLLYQGVIQPRQSRLKQAAVLQAELKQQYVSQWQPLSTVDELAKQLQQQTEQWQQLQQRYLNSISMAELIARVSAISYQQGLAVVEIAPLDKAPLDKVPLDKAPIDKQPLDAVLSVEYQEIRLSIHIRGSYHQLGHFVAALAEQQPLMNLTDVVIEQSVFGSETASHEWLDIHATVKSYALLEGDYE